MELKDKVAIVTGAGCGIGRAIALKLAADGAKVVVNDVVSERATTTVEAIRASQGEAIFVQADVSLWEGARQMVAECIAS